MPRSGCPALHGMNPNLKNHLCWSLCWNSFRPEILLKRGSSTGVFLWILQIFKNIFFYRTYPGNYFWKWLDVKMDFAISKFLLKFYLHKNCYSAEQFIAILLSNSLLFSWAIHCYSSEQFIEMAWIWAKGLWNKRNGKMSGKSDSDNMTTDYGVILIWSILETVFMVVWWAFLQKYLTVKFRI